MKSLRLKLTLVIFVATLIALGAVTYLNYSRTSEILMAELSKAAAGSAEYNAKIINEWLNGIVKDINNRAAGATVKSMDPAQFLPVLKRVQSQNKDYEYLYVADKNGNGIGTNDVPVNVADRDYFPKVMQGQTVISDPIVSKATGNHVIAVVAPVYKDGDNKPDGLVGVTVTLDYLQELVKNMKLSGQGYGFIQTAGMITIAHPNREYLGNNKMLNDADARLKELLQKMSRGEKGYGHYTLGGVDKMLAYAPVELSGWAVAQTANISDVMAPLAVMRNASLAVTLVALLVMVGVAFIIAGYISGPVIKLSRAAEAVARGDLAHGMDQVAYAGRDEIGILADAFKKMVDNLKAMIDGIQKSSNQLAAQSQELAASSEEVSATIEEVASTTSEVAATSAQGAENAEEAARESEQVLGVAAEGSRAVRQAIEKINSMASASRNVAMAIEKLGGQSNRIGEIINTITDIAEQTNLLALNAAIEAARAGEHGRGFAVVAEEVRKLAEQSAGAAGEITGLVREIQVGVEEAIKAMEQGAAEVGEGVQVAGNAGAAIEQIIKAVEKNTEAIRDVAEGAKQSNEGTQQLSAASEQIASTIQQVSNAAQELASIAAELQNAIARFKV